MLQLKKINESVYIIETKLRFISMNNYLIFGDNSTILIDTGFVASKKEILRFFEKYNIDLNKIDIILNTHCHLDHSGKNKFLKSHTNAKLMIHEKDRAPVESFEGIKKQVGSFADEYEEYWKQRLKWWNYEGGCEVDKTISDNEIFDLGNHTLRVIFSPGHTLGHCCFLLDKKILFAGDMGFESLWYGNARASLLDYIKTYQRLISLDLNLVLSGHLDPVKEGIKERYEKRRSQLLDRDKKILDSIKNGHNTIEKLVKLHITVKNRSTNLADRLWQDYGEKNQISQHLNKLEQEGKIIKVDDKLTISNEK
ncbi:MAG: MBL fold metallo-hydrolase [Candidatus Hodarchaeota archaeon]